MNKINLLLHRLLAEAMLLAVFLVAGRLSARAADGVWQTYLATEAPSQIEHLGNYLYLRTGNSLWRMQADTTAWLADSSATEAVQLSRINGLSDISVQHMCASQVAQRLAIVYSSGAIDILDMSDRLLPVYDLKNKTLSADKTVNAVRECQDGKIYVAGGFGLMVVDLLTGEVPYSYTDRPDILLTFHWGDRLYRYSTEGGLEYLTDGENGYNPSGWHAYADAESALVDVQVFSVDGRLFCWCAMADGSLVQLRPDHGMDLIAQGSYTSIHPLASRILTKSGSTRISVHNPTTGRVTSTTLQPYASLTDFVAMDDTLVVMTSSSQGLYYTHISTYNEANGALNFQTVWHTLRPDGLATTMPGSMLLSSDGHLVTIARGYLPTYSFVPASSLPGIMSTLDPATGIWHTTASAQVRPQLTPGFNFQGLHSLCEDSKHPGRYYLSSLLFGIYCIEGDSLVAHLNHETTGGGVAYISADFNSDRVSGLYSDPDGCLWFTNSHCDIVLCCLTPAGTFIKFPISALDGGAAENVCQIMAAQHDSYHFKWLVNDYGYDRSNITLYYDGGTTADLSDDESVTFNSLTDQDGNVWSPHYFRSVCEDGDGNVWILTSSGPFCVESSIDCYRKPGTCRRIKIPRNDGTNLADYLLADVHCQTMTIDAAGRKWVGTLESGLYCLSADGITEIHHFTTSNSPLLSDNILSLAYDDESGVLYIGCEGGIVAYLTDAVRGAEDLSGVYCYPNPVRPDYTGMLNVKGLMDKSQVAITDVAGRVVYRAQSAGGQLTWNLLTSDGRRVAPGVYLVMGTDAAGKEGRVSKFLVLE